MPMVQFTSSKEKKLWLWASLVAITIFSTLFIGQPFERLLRDQNTQAILFLTGMLLVGVVILMNGLRAKPDKVNITILIGLAAVYVMFFFRLGAPERSHLIEYSVLSIFVYSAVIERVGQGNQQLVYALIAFLISFMTGVIDESIQLFIPERVFDVQDIFFNGVVSAMAIGSTMILSWMRKRMDANRFS